MLQSLTPTPIALTDAGGAKDVQRAIRAVHRLGVALLQHVALPAPVDVVDQRDVDGIGAEALQAVLERAQRRVVAVVVVEAERIGAAARPCGRTARLRVEQAPHLRRQHDGAPVDLPQAFAESMLREAHAVERRDVEVAQSGGVQRVERAMDRRVGRSRRQRAERRTADAELRDGRDAVA